MTRKDEDLLKQLLATFRIEAREHLDAMSAGLLEIGKAGAPEERAEIIETTYREAHSLKGAARTVNQTGIESICQALESVLGAVKSAGGALSQDAVEAMLDALSVVEAQLAGIENAQQPPPQERVLAIARRLAALTESGAGEGAEATPARRARPPARARPSPPKAEPVAEPAPPPTAAQAEAPRAPGSESPGQRQPPEEPREPAQARYDDAPAREQLPVPAVETVRIPIAKLDSLLFRSEELLHAKLAANERVGQLRELRTLLADWRKARTKIAAAMRPRRRDPSGESALHGPAPVESGWASEAELFGEDAQSFAALEEKVWSLSEAIEDDRRVTHAMVDRLIEEAKSVLMLPFSTVTRGFPRMVRDLAHDRGRAVDFQVNGADIELDKRILEEIKDPLVHMLRNCVDHGIEEPARRRRAGKTELGVITLAVSQVDGDKVEITVSDDGVGIDCARVKQAAVKAGVLSQQDARPLADEETIPLIFESGVSSSEIITDISGRGLGMAIVREKVEKLGGDVSVRSRPGRGTTCRLLLPITLATFKGVLVRVDAETFIIPTSSVEAVLRAPRERVKTVENRETVPVKGTPVSLVRLGDVLELGPERRTADGSDFINVVVVASGGRRVAFRTSEIRSEEEVLVKSLGPQLARVPNVSGAAVLGSGDVVLVLNVADLLKSAAASGRAGPAGDRGADETPAKAVMLVEDSITARMLLRNILEGSGYDVTTAVDGAEAYATLRTDHFDLVVSDVEMPRMDGFELTQSIRRDERLKDLPVVLVTARETREDRERGIDAGANAYIVKSSFDQTNLLSVMERLL